MDNIRRIEEHSGGATIHYEDGDTEHLDPSAYRKRFPQIARKPPSERIRAWVGGEPNINAGGFPTVADYDVLEVADEVAALEHEQTKLRVNSEIDIRNLEDEVERLRETVRLLKRIYLRP